MYKDAEKLLIDVSGPHGNDDVTDDDDLPDDVRLVHVSDLRTLLLSAQVYNASSSHQQPPQPPAVSDVLPLVVYVRRDEALTSRDPWLTVLTMLPSVTALEHNEVCRLSGHSSAMFSLRQHDDVTSVMLNASQSATRTGRYQLSIICESHAHLGRRPFTLYLHVQLI